ncbi:putative signal peptide protein [Puccinia sorghi]|uniref:Putative signal peptide protein n=1 Tax=Puccinia sorghi TaxID=27349 RepID=A0A0L6UPQ6_9BASI|nr:putative signal peptide protein [Puccinia sorghi]
MQFPAVVAACLVCVRSVSAFLPLGFLGGPSQMSGCRKQGGMINVGALNQNNCIGGTGLGGMYCGKQGGLINAPGFFAKNHDSKNADNTT